MSYNDFSDKAARYRASIPQAREGLIYLNHCAVSPVTDSVQQAVLDALELRRDSRIDRFERQLQVVAETRGMLADITGSGNPDRVAFMQNTTNALNTVAQGFPWQAGDEVLVADCEFSSNVYAWKNLKRRGVNTRFVPAPDGRVTPERIRNAITSGTRMVAVSSVQYVSGFRANIAAIGRICREHNLYLVVDGIQAAGALPQYAAEWGADAYCGGAHKWLMGPQGIGYLCVSERLHDLLEPVMPGWLSVPDPWHLYNFNQATETTARRYEGGTYNTAGIFGLHASLRMLLEVGPERSETHILKLAARLTDGFAALGIPAAMPYGSDNALQTAADRAANTGSGATEHPKPQYRGRPDTSNGYSPHSGITAFQLDPAADHNEIIQFYRNNGIFISVRSGMLRIAPHFWNTTNEIDAVINVTARMPRLQDQYLTAQN
ncbi:MAG: aminotransferase class V-fold PLP-dependent enzyme [Cyclonatronaceae bacterium]